MASGALRVTRYTFGESVSLSRRKAGGVAYYLSTYWALSEERVALTSAEVETTYGDEAERGPFERADFGDRERLAWANGACAMETDAKLTFWAQRYVMWFEGSDMCAVDATRSVAVQLALPIEAGSAEKTMLHEGTLYLVTRRSVVVIAIADIEELFERTTGPRDVRVREIYPLRRPDGKQEMLVDWDYQGKTRLKTKTGGWSSLSIPSRGELREGDEITLHHVLASDQYLEFSVHGGPRIPLYTSSFPPDHEGAFALQVEPAADPAGMLVRASHSVRGAELDQMFASLADEPDDEAARMVVVDLLEDAGEPYAPLFAKLLAGDETVRTQALGTLASYLDDVAWHGNLPRRATLAATAPLDEDIGDIVMADHRLGFFTSLLLGGGNFRLYAKLVASPRAIGLRHVDGSRLQTLKAVIAAGRTNLRRLTAVKFVSREVIEALANPAFDRVVDVETETQTTTVDRLLDYITRDEATFFARAPRHLTLMERGGDDDVLVTAVLAAWPRLPVAKLTFANITLDKDGTARASPDASDTLRGILASKFRLV